jgi:hypothetical protein
MLIGLPPVLVAVAIGVTVVAHREQLTTQAVLPSGVIAIAQG